VILRPLGVAVAMCWLAVSRNAGKIKGVDQKKG